MYAVVETGGKQYKVSKGDVITVEKLPAEVNDSVTLDRVLLLGSGSDIKIGTPTVEGAKVVAKVLAHGKGKKIRIFKYKPKKNYRRRQGHRQPFTKLLIEAIEG
ncbi:MAG: 50S ribosomal protein L21 [Firmicutes bacterium]|nr:50S ribosomal protein L21 [Bacillota bacterium]